MVRVYRIPTTDCFEPTKNEKNIFLLLFSILSLFSFFPFFPFLFFFGDFETRAGCKDRVRAICAHSCVDYREILAKYRLPKRGKRRFNPRPIPVELPTTPNDGVWATSDKNSWGISDSAITITLVSVRRNINVSTDQLPRPAAFNFQPRVWARVGACARRLVHTGETGNVQFSINPEVNYGRSIKGSRQLSFSPHRCILYFSSSFSLSLSLVRALSPLSHAPFFYGFLGWVLRTGEPAVFGEAELLDLVCRMFRVRDV